MKLIASLVIFLVSLNYFVFGDEVIFSTKPVITKAGDTVKINFTVSKATDVEICAISAEGKIICHIAAGVLGAELPPPLPLKTGLTQEIIWDGKDNFGKKVENISNLNIRVRAGMKPVFDGFVGASPYSLCTVRYAPIRGMVLDSQGNLYVLEVAYNGSGSADVRVFDRSGNYVKSLMPFPANLNKAEVAPFGLIDDGSPFVVPRNQGNLWAYLYDSFPKGYSRAYGPLNIKLNAITPDGTLMFLDETFRVLCRINSKNGSAIGSNFGVSLWAEGDKRYNDYAAKGGTPSMVVSSDGKTLYFTGFALAAEKGKKLSNDLPDGRVYKCSIEKIGQGLETFVDISLPEKLAPPVSGWANAMSSSSMQGLATDSKGNLYVCDSANGAVHRFDSAGKETGALAFPNASKVVIDDKSQTVYVLTRGKTLVLAKFSSCEAGAKLLAKLELIGTNENEESFLAVDFGGAKPQVWLGNANGSKEGHGLLRIEDNGSEFKILEDVSNRDPMSLRGVDRITVDPETDDVYVSNGWINIYRYAGLTGKYNGDLKGDKMDPLVATDVTVSPDGYVYIQQGPSFSGSFQRLDKNLKPAPLKGSGKDIFGWVFGRYGQGYCTKGSVVDYKGRLLTLGMLAWCEYFVSTYDLDGNFIPGPILAKSQIERLKTQPDHGDLKPLGDRGINSALIGPVTAASGGIKIDKEGSVYLGLNLFPEGFKPPTGFEKDKAYATMIGSVVKFNPKGGGLIEGKPIGKASSYNGVEKIYPGYGSFSGSDENKDAGNCVCRSPRFDLDPYGRLYLPNTATFNVRILDNSGNEICNIGHYGNFDSQWVPEGSKDGKPIVDTPEIPLAWPLSVGVSDKMIYIGDLYNRRVVRVAKKFTIEELCKIK
jgi:sugar lactone lactonase YvrE